MKSSIILKLISWVITIIGVITFVLGPNSGDNQNKDAMVSAGLVILVITAIVTVIFSVINILRRPKILKNFLMSLGVMFVLFIIAYVIAGDGAVYNAAGQLKLEAGSTSKWVSTGLWYSIILLVIGGGLFIVDMIKNIVK